LRISPNHPLRRLFADLVAKELPADHSTHRRLSACGNVLMPIFAGAILHGGAHTLGFLMAAAGLGALTGAVTLAKRPSVLGLGRVIVWSATGTTGPA
jgi:Transmembrane secretion effector